jgi:hypothetical protein
MFGRHTDAESAALGRHFLARLERAVAMAGRADVAALPGWRRLARHAAFSAYRDCLALGLEREARAAIGRVDRPAAGVR